MVLCTSEILITIKEVISEPLARLLNKISETRSLSKVLKIGQTSLQIRTERLVSDQDKDREKILKYIMDSFLNRHKIISNK